MGGRQSVFERRAKIPEAGKKVKNGQRKDKRGVTTLSSSLLSSFFRSPVRNFYSLRRKEGDLDFANSSRLL